MDKEIIQEILDFRDNRNWKQFHNPKDLSISISLEAAELLENFQWSGDDLTVQSKINLMKEELADILIYCVFMADALDIDINEIIKDKLRKNMMKYSVEKSFGSNKKYTELGDAE